MLNGAVFPVFPNQEQIDPFLQTYDTNDLRTAYEFLSVWLPFLSKGLCSHCTHLVSCRVQSVNPFVEFDAKQVHGDREVRVSTSTDLNGYVGNQDHQDVNETDDTNSLGSWKDAASLTPADLNGYVGDENYLDVNETDDTKSLGSWKDGADGLSEQIGDLNLRTERVQTSEHIKSSRTPRMSWADMAQEEEFEADEEEEARSKYGNNYGHKEETSKVKTTRKPGLSREQRERIRLSNVTRKKDYICLERVNGKIVNILGGLELHCGIFSTVEQKRIVDFVYELEDLGKKGKLRDRTYTAPQKWMRGKGRVTIQFGCCYNYATDRSGNPPGILRNELVDPIPPLFKIIIKRLVTWHVLPPTCVPDSCIVNIYDEGDCIPPHIDNHDFLRPFCTVSFLSECKIVFGTTLKIEGPGDFSGAFDIPLPVGSVLVLNGNGADVAKHCVPAVPTKRISITFRKMDTSKHPVGFIPESDLQGIEPLAYEPDKPKAGSNLYKPSRTSNREGIRRDDIKESSTGYSQPRFYGQTRQQGPSFANRRNTRLEY